MSESEDQEVDFREADRRYAEIKRRHEAGNLTDEEFDEQLKQLMVQDDEGRWWVKSRSSGDWYFHNGTAWIKDTPPGYEPILAASRVTSPTRGGPSSSPARAPTSPRTILLRWLAPLAFVGLVIIVVAIARNTGGDSDHAGGGGGPATPPRSHTATSKPTPTSIDLPFSDHFSHSSSTWDKRRGKDGGNYYDDGGYRIYSSAGKARVVSKKRAGPYQDVAVEVDTKVLNSQPDLIAWGVVCRQLDQDNYYSMVVFGNGYVSILKNKDAKLIKIAEDDRSEVIGGNVVSPHIRGECVGNTLTLYVDNKKVMEAEDPDFRSGGVGLFVNSGDSTAGAKILFDNFSVKKP